MWARVARHHLRDDFCRVPRSGGEGVCSCMLSQVVAGCESLTCGCFHMWHDVVAIL